MKNTTKTLLSIAIIAALPFTANATQTIVETNTPAAVGANGTVKKAAATGPYQTATIGEHDDEHIATTAYVKGAYNDAIAAVNKVSDDLAITQASLSELDTILGDRATELEYGKQDQLVNFDTGSDMGTNVVGANNDVLREFDQADYDYDEIMSGILPDIEQQLGIDYSDSLITAEAAIKLYALVSRYTQRKLSTTVNNQSQNISSTIAQTVNTTTPSANTLVSEAAIAGAMNNYATNSALNSKRVTIYTTWGNDTSAATTQVPFTTAQ